MNLYHLADAINYYTDDCKLSENISLKQPNLSQFILNSSVHKIIVTRMGLFYYCTEPTKLRKAFEMKLNAGIVPFFFGNHLACNENAFLCKLYIRCKFVVCFLTLFSIA